LVTIPSTKLIMNHCFWKSADGNYLCLGQTISM
jgi:hypothetical protein